MTHIILLDGKLWAFEPPEKPKSPTIGQSVEYERACFRALEQKLEVDNQEEVRKWLNDGQLISLSENEPIKWDGTVEIVTQRLNKLDGSQGASRKVCRLIAPVKEEKKEPCAYEEECQYPACNCGPMITPSNTCPKCRTRDFASCHSMQCPMRKAEPVPSDVVKEEPTHGQRMKAIRKRADWLKLCLDNGWSKNALPGLEKIWDDLHDEFGNLTNKPVPSEQEKQEEIWKELFNLIEGPTSDRYIQAMKRFSITVNNNRP